MGPLTPSDGSNPQISPAGNPQPFQRSSWAYFHGSFDYDDTPLGPLGCNIIAHKKTGTINSWDFRGKAGWNVGVALQHYRCHAIVAKTTKASQVSDTVEFRHHHLNLTEITPAGRIFHIGTTLTCALRDAPVIAYNNQLAVIQALRQAIQQWDKPTRPVAKKPQVTTHPSSYTRQRSILRPMRRPRKDEPQDLLPRVVI